MTKRCPAARVLGAAELRGYRLFFRGADGRAVATVEPLEGGSVPVLVWSITRADQAALDRYEGYPFLYRRERLPVLLSGKAVTAMVYVMNEGRPPGAPNGYYYRVIREGYLAAGFDEEILRTALRASSGNPV